MLFKAALFCIQLNVFLFHISQTGQSEIQKACDLLFQKAEAIDYRYDVNDSSVEGLLILPLYGAMPTGNNKHQCLKPE